MSRRPSLESATLVTLFLTVVAVAGSSSWSVGLRDVVQPFRTVGLVALCGLGIAYALRSGPRPRLSVPHVLAMGFLALAAASIAWSVDPRHTLVRGGAFGLALVAAQAIGVGVRGRGRAARRFLVAVLLAACVVAIAGVVTYVVSPDDGVQQATRSVGVRFRGIGQSPNTMSMLFAVALPIAALVVLEARSFGRRAWAGAAFVLLAGSIAMSGSRGALAATVAGLALFGWCVASHPRSRAAVGVAVATLAAALVALGALPEPLSAAEAAKAKSPSANAQRYTPNDAEYDVRLEDEIGYSRGGSSSRFLSGSGRLDAWQGALGQGEQRPLLGYGFGTEETVFVDRFENFQGGVPENSFLGIFLQLGVIGVALFSMLAAAVALAARKLLPVDRNLAAACLAVLTGGLALSLAQSYVYAYGNVAMLAVWLAAFVAGGAQARASAP